VITNRQTRDQAPEHEFEAELGLPEPLPRGERLLWQGAPDWRVLAREAMHTRLLSVYFALLLGARGINVLANGGSVAEAGLAMLWLLPLAAAALGLLALLAWLVCRTSVYTLTDRRVVMRIGVVLSITFNLPYSQIESAGLRANADGTGDITLVLAETDRIAYVHLWPHARPWHLKRSEQMLRALPQVQGVAEILAQALAASVNAVRAGRAPIQVPMRMATDRTEPQALAA
jgi:Bacterial PH domain